MHGPTRAFGIDSQCNGPTPGEMVRKLMDVVTRAFLDLCANEMEYSLHDVAAVWYGLGIGFALLVETLSPLMLKLWESTV